jgi:V/A-type H+-transporting ATPase subunit I
MITKMKKLTFLIYYKEYEAFLKRMQELGVLHVQTASRRDRKSKRQRG